MHCRPAGANAFTSITKDLTDITTAFITNLNARAFRGLAAQEVVLRYRADWTVLGTCALHLMAGATVTDESDAALKRAMVRSGVRTMVLADSSKRDTIVAHVVLTSTELDLVISDQPWEALQKLGVQVITSSKTSKTTKARVKL